MRPEFSHFLPSEVPKWLEGLYPGQATFEDEPGRAELLELLDVRMNLSFDSDATVKSYAIESTHYILENFLLASPDRCKPFYSTARLEHIFDLFFMNYDAEPEFISNWLMTILLSWPRDIQEPKRQFIKKKFIFLVLDKLDKLYGRRIDFDAQVEREALFCSLLSGAVAAFCLDRAVCFDLATKLKQPLLYYLEFWFVYVTKDWSRSFREGDVVWTNMGRRPLFLIGNHFIRLLNNEARDVYEKANSDFQWKIRLAGFTIREADGAGLFNFVQFDSTPLHWE